MPLLWGTELRVLRLLSSKNFEQVLSCSPLVRKGHFALHYLAASPSATLTKHLVLNAPTVMPSGSISVHLGLVVPKRYARRSVTRSLIKRKTRAIFEKSAGCLPGGMWVVRLAKPFHTAVFNSARSPALRQCLQIELEDLVSDFPGLA
jgi:ribonuclease P protein component